MAFCIVNTDPQIDAVLAQLSISADVDVSLNYLEGQPLKIEKHGNAATITYGRRVELFRGLGLLAEYCGEKT